MKKSLGTKIKTLRDASKVSTADMAIAAGISAEQVEQIEGDAVAPTISTLIKFARLLGVRVGTLLDGEESIGPTVTRSQAGDKADRLSDASAAKARTHMNYVSLAQGKKDRNMEPYIVDIDHIEPVKENFQSHEGEEFFYILEGVIVVHYGTEIYELPPGDSIYYDSVVPHCVTTPDSQKAKILAVIYTPY